MKLTAKVKDWIRQTILDAREWNYNKIADMLADRIRKIGRRKNEMKIYFSIALMAGLFLFSIISGNALASMSS